MGRRPLLLALAAGGAVAVALLGWWRMSRPLPPRAAVALLVDNGSLRAASTLSLRRLAGAVEAALGPGGPRVLPVSARISDRAPADGMGGVPPEVLEPALHRLAAAGATDFVVLPAFLGPSDTIAEYVPAVFARVAGAHKGPHRLRLTLAGVLVPTPMEPEPEGAAAGLAAAAAAEDTRVARMLVDGVAATIAEHGLRAPHVVVCDHGSPLAAVAAVRDRVAAQVRAMLMQRQQQQQPAGSAPTVASVAVASMERRPGPAYAFNDPLLEVLLRRPPYSGVGGEEGGGGAVSVASAAWAGGDTPGTPPTILAPPVVEVVVAMMFLSPGKHAGAGGDVASILAAARADAAAAGVVQTAYMTPLLGEHPALVQVLAERLLAALPAVAGVQAWRGQEGGGKEKDS